MTTLGEEVLLGQGKLQSSGPSRALTTQKGEEGVSWAPSGSSGSWGTHWTRRGRFSGTRLPEGRGLTVSSDSPQIGEGSCGRIVWTGGREREKGEERKTKSEVERAGGYRRCPSGCGMAPAAPALGGQGPHLCQTPLLLPSKDHTSISPNLETPLLPPPPRIWVLPPTLTVKRGPQCHRQSCSAPHCHALHTPPVSPPPAVLLRHTWAQTTLSISNADPPPAITWCGGAGLGWLQGRWPAEGGQ